MKGQERILSHKNIYLRSRHSIIIEMNIQERYRKPVEEFVRRALERYRNKIEGIILFGSVARNEGKEDSDVDVLLLDIK